MKKVIIKLPIALGFGLLIFELTGNIYISRNEYKIEHITDSQLVKKPIPPQLNYDFYTKLYDVGLYSRSFEEFKSEYSDSISIYGLYSKLFESKAYTKTYKDFKKKYFVQRGDTTKYFVYKKKIERKNKLQIGIREYFNKRIAYTSGIITFSILLLIFFIPELKDKWMDNPSVENKERIKNRFNEMLDIINKMKYNENNLLGLISLVKEARSLVDNDDNYYHCKNNLRQTFQKQISDVMMENLGEKERERYFFIAISDFRLDLRECLANYFS